MKKIVLLWALCLFLCSCSTRQENAFESGTESVNTAETEGGGSSVSSETAETENAGPFAPDISGTDGLGVNEDGTLSEDFTKRIEQLMLLEHEEKGEVFPSLYDFNDDGIPEIFLIIHNGGQGYMPCKVYSAADLAYLGEFEGFCRDGFTRFEHAYGGTLIYNYYEHSIHQRQSDVTFAQLAGGKLETVWLCGESGNVRAGEYRPTIDMAESRDDKALEWLAEKAYGSGYGNLADELVSNFRAFRGGEVFTSLYSDVPADRRASAAVESYNDRIKFGLLAPAPDHKDYDIYRLILMGDRNQMAFIQCRVEGSDEIGLYFIDENSEWTLLSTTGYYSVYRLWDSLVVCQPLGNSMPCDVYTVKDGKAELIEEISGEGMYLDLSRLYNGGFSLMQSVYDGVTSGGGHTFKKYQFYFDEYGVHEYGSIVIPLEEFYAAHGDEIREFEARIAEDGYEIYEVLYRADDCFILNMRQPIYYFDDDKEQEIFSGAYYQKYAAIKPMIDGTLSDTVIESDDGVYLTALCPDIAVYPEKVYSGE